MVKLKMTFPEEFFKEEERCGHFISAGIKKVWAVELDLLNEFMRVCDKHGLKYWADAGTILGAVRHKGFIPWDDDIDVMMMRDEYEKFCRIAPEEFKHPYFWQTAETDEGYITEPGRLRNSGTTRIYRHGMKNLKGFNQGIFIDVFQLDAIPDDEKLFQKQAKNIKRYKKRTRRFNSLTYCYKIIPRWNVLSLIKRQFLHLLAIGPMKKQFDYTVPYKKFVEECQKYNGTPTKRIGKLTMSTEPRRIWQRAWFDDTVFLPFEMFQLPVPKGYEKILDTFYGDWQAFVKRTATDSRIFHDTDKPYTEYIPWDRRN